MLMSLSFTMSRRFESTSIAISVLTGGPVLVWVSSGLRTTYEGVLSIIDLLDAQSAALVAEQSAANATYQFLLDLMEAERAIGGVVQLDPLTVALLDLVVRIEQDLGDQDLPRHRRRRGRRRGPGSPAAG